MKRLNGMDAMLLYSETPNVHTHTLKVAVINARDLAGEFDFEVFRRAFPQRLELMEPLRYRLVEIPFGFHHPMWLENCDVDLDYHLRRVRVPSPGGRRELDEVIGQVASTPLDRTRPLWEFYFAEGMADDRFAIIGKVHHALADGMASANLLSRLIDAPQSDESTGARGARPRPPSRSDLLWEASRDHVGHVAAVPGLVKDAVSGISKVRRRSKERPDNVDLGKNFDPPQTFLNHIVSPTRTFATAALALADVKETAKQLGVTFNDVVLAMAAGGLRELLLRYDGRADQPLLTSVPVSTDRSADRITGNQIGGLQVSLPVHVDDPLERVRLTALSSARAKEDFDLLGPDLQGRLMEYLPPSLAPKLFRRQSARAERNRTMNIAVSNVPGPRKRANVAGAPVCEFYSVGILSAGSALNITVWSYVDQLDISVLSDDRTFNDVHEATDALIHAFGEIRRAAGLSDVVGVPDSAMAPATG